MHSWRERDNKLRYIRMQGSTPDVVLDFYEEIKAVVCIRISRMIIKKYE
jgi:hypothetical protein